MVIDVDKIGIKWVPIDRGLTPKEYEKYAKDIAGIVKENSLRGAKSITKNKQGFPSVRIHLEPEFVYINGLRVFLAHATKDRSWADEVFVILEKMGFKVTYLPVDEKSKGSSSTENSQPGVVRLIEESVENSDYLCMLFSKNSASREWVRYEFQLAARLIGRIVMLKDSSVETIADFEIPRFERMAQLTVKTQILDYRGDDPDIGKKIARVIINDPDEGDTDGSYRPLVIWERNLKIENRRRRYVRLALDNIRVYSDRHVVDILPFVWEEISVSDGDWEIALEWLVKNYGRLNLAYQLRNGKVRVSAEEFSVDKANMKTLLSGKISALVFWKPEWDYDKGFNNNKANI